MNEHDISTAASTNAASAANNAIAEPDASRPMESASAAVPRKTTAWVWALGAIAVLVVGQWWMSQQQLSSLREEVARRLAEADAVARDSRTLAHTSQEALLDMQSKIGGMDVRVAELQSQQTTLAQLYQDVGRVRDESVLVEVEQAILLASQQLALASNVQAALVALQGAETRLTETNRPQFFSLRKQLTRDIEKLRALPQSDISGLTLKLDGVIAVVDELGFAYERHPLPAPKGEPPAQNSTWLERLSNDVWQELKGLVRIERLDGADPALLAPDQGFFLRENLRLRLLNARLMLLQRDTRVFRRDVQQARQWIQRHFDTRTRQAQNALLQLDQLAQADLSVELPSLADTLAQISALRQRNH